MIFMKHPLVVLTLIFSLGIVLVSKIEISFLGLYFLSAAFYIFTILSQKESSIFSIFMFLSVLLLGASSLKKAQESPSCHILKYIDFARQEPYVIKGFIANEPLEEDNSTSFKFNAEAIQSVDTAYSCCGQILVHVKAKEIFAMASS